MAYYINNNDIEQILNHLATGVSLSTACSHEVCNTPQSLFSICKDNIIMCIKFQQETLDKYRYKHQITIDNNICFGCCKHPCNTYKYLNFKCNCHKFRIGYLIYKNFYYTYQNNSILNNILFTDVFNAVYDNSINPFTTLKHYSCKYPSSIQINCIVLTYLSFQINLGEDIDDFEEELKLRTLLICRSCSAKDLSLIINDIITEPDTYEMTYFDLTIFKRIIPLNQIKNSIHDWLTKINCCYCQKPLCHIITCWLSKHLLKNPHYIPYVPHHKSESFTFRLNPLRNTFHSNNLWDLINHFITYKCKNYLNCDCELTDTSSSN